MWVGLDIPKHWINFEHTWIIAMMFPTIKLNPMNDFLKTLIHGGTVNVSWTM